MELKTQIYEQVMAELARQGIEDVQYSALTPSERRYVGRYFESSILPIVSPIIIGSHHPVPHLNSKELHIAALLTDKKGRKSVGLIPLPASLPPYVKLPDTDIRFIRIENVILQWAGSMFGSYQVAESCVISLTRNADISFDGEKYEDSEEDFRSRVAKVLKKRGSLSVVRLEVDRRISNDFTSRLMQLLKVERYQIYTDTCPLDMGYVYKLAGEISPYMAASMLYTPYKGRWPEDISREHGIIEQVRESDKLLFYPFDSTEPFLKLLNEAAERPDVISIKITIYRLASSSKIARTLCRAAENGKEVIVLMELRARFDEANNLQWSKLMEEAGCQVVYGIEDYKCHSKICLITMRGKNGVSYITQIGTGNYNEKTCTMYTDLCLMTASKAIGEDGTAFFRNMLVNNLSGEYRELLVAPSGIKSALCRLIDEEIAKGEAGYICIKSNAVTERDIIDKLSAASRAGVEVQLIIRGICCVLPGVPEHTENIHVTSIVGRYLEHARIYCFGRGEAARLYIASADMMTRNLNRRVEIACPVYDPDIKRQLLWILESQLRDDCKASFMMPDGVYSRKHSQTEISFDSQREFMSQSPHKPASYTPPRRSALQRFAAYLGKLLSAI